MSKENVRFFPVILAGGSGTRFWPRSRRAKAKQVLALDGERTMIQQTLERLEPLAPAEDVWVITNELLAAEIGAQLPAVPRAQILREPMACNTAPACGLAAFLVDRLHPGAVIGIFPSDQVVKRGARFVEVMRAGVELAAGGDKVVVIGVPPTRAETGYGYIELGEAVPGGAIDARRVRRFTEKPDAETAKQFLSAGNYAWNGGIFLWSAKTLADAIREFQPEMAEPLEKIAAAYGMAEFERVFAEQYALCKSISVDYAVMEPRSAKGEEKAEIYCLPGDFEWNDLGSWTALREHLAEEESANVVEGGAEVLIDARGNYVYAPGKTVALVGVEDLVVVETKDALLITTRHRAQDVGMVVRRLSDEGKHELL